MKNGIIIPDERCKWRVKHDSSHSTHTPGMRWCGFINPCITYQISPQHGLCYIKVVLIPGGRKFINTATF